MIISKDSYDNERREEGREEATISHVMNCLEKNMSDKDIIDITEISQEQLDKIKVEYRNQQTR